MVCPTIGHHRLSPIRKSNPFRPVANLLHRILAVDRKSIKIRTHDLPKTARHSEILRCLFQRESQNRYVQNLNMSLSSKAPPGRSPNLRSGRLHPRSHVRARSGTNTEMSQIDRNAKHAESKPPKDAGPPKATSGLEKRSNYSQRPSIAFKPNSNH